MPNNLNLQEIDQEQALNLAKFFIRSQQNLYIFGQKGIGKTELLMQAAKECKLKVNYLNLSVLERNDLAGYPNIFDSSSDIISFKSPYFLPKLETNKKPDSIILFDEIDKTSPEITAPLLEILQFKKINGVPINAVSCVLTGNLLDENVNANQISTALLDRGAKYILKFDFNNWYEWGKTNNIDPLILGFLRSNQDCACGKIEDNNYASPSPRGWTYASKSLNQAKKMKMLDAETIFQIVAGFVGNEVSLKFKSWYEYYRKYEKFIQILIEKGELTLDLKKLLPTELIVFVISACNYAKQKSIENKGNYFYLENLCNFLENYQIELEMQMLGLNNSFTFDLITKYKFFECKRFFDLFTILNQELKKC